jgi:hypothetical protein
MPSVLYKTRYVSALPTMASLLSSLPHFSPGTVTTRLCINAMGNEFEFMNMAAAMAKFLPMVTFLAALKLAPALRQKLWLRTFEKASV